jgi:saccharopine dehydrogenase-like NADP-dependent oxidoreductase
MKHKVLVVGAGDAGRRIAEFLLQRERISELTLADLPGGLSEKHSTKLAGCHAALIKFVGIDALDHRDVEALLRRTQPDLTGHPDLEGLDVDSPGRRNPVHQL